MSSDCVEHDQSDGVPEAIARLALTSLNSEGPDQPAGCISRPECRPCTATDSQIQGVGRFLLDDAGRRYKIASNLRMYGLKAFSRKTK